MFHSKMNTKDSCLYKIIPLLPSFLPPSILKHNPYFFFVSHKQSKIEMDSKHTKICFRKWNPTEKNSASALQTDLCGKFHVSSPYTKIKGCESPKSVQHSLWDSANNFSSMEKKMIYSCEWAGKFPRMWGKKCKISL